MFHRQVSSFNGLLLNHYGAGCKAAQGAKQAEFIGKESQSWSGIEGSQKIFQVKGSQKIFQGQMKLLGIHSIHHDPTNLRKFH